MKSCNKNRKNRATLKGKVHDQEKPVIFTTYISVFDSNFSLSEYTVGKKLERTRNTLKGNLEQSHKYCCTFTYYVELVLLQKWCASQLLLNQNMCIVWQFQFVQVKSVNRTYINLIDIPLYLIMLWNE